MFTLTLLQAAKQARQSVANWACYLEIVGEVKNNPAAVALYHLDAAIVREESDDPAPQTRQA